MKISMKPIAILSGREDVALSKPFLGLSDKVLGQIRTGLAFVGGILITTGTIQATQAEITEVVDITFQVLGSISTIVSAVSSWFSRDKR